MAGWYVLAMETFTGISIIVVFFFFQAEDGIRDTSVTGVQTCALPILLSDWEGHPVPRNPIAPVTGDARRGRTQEIKTERSEERRVGKECRGRSATYQEKKKKRQATDEQRRVERNRQAGRVQNSRKPRG